VSALAPSALPGRRPSLVADIMARPVLTVATSDSLWDAWQLLFVSGLRHLVVLDQDGSTVGVLSDRNVLAEAPVTAEHLGSRRVADALAHVPIVFAKPSDAPDRAASVMAANAVEALPVLDDDDRLAGIVTESDIVKWVASTAR